MMKQREIRDPYNSSDSQCPLTFSESPDRVTCPLSGNEENGTLKCLHCGEYSCLECDENFIWDKITAPEQGSMFFTIPRKIEAYNIASLLFIGLVIFFLFIH
jgi:hypothetical protein